MDQASSQSSAAQSNSEFDASTLCDPRLSLLQSNLSNLASSDCLSQLNQDIQSLYHPNLQSNDLSILNSSHGISNLAQIPDILQSDLDQSNLTISSMIPTNPIDLVPQSPNNPIQSVFDSQSINQNIIVQSFPNLNQISMENSQPDQPSDPIVNDSHLNSSQFNQNLIVEIKETSISDQNESLSQSFPQAIESNILNQTQKSQSESSSDHQIQIDLSSAQQLELPLSVNNQIEIDSSNFNQLDPNLSSNNQIQSNLSNLDSSNNPITHNNPLNNNIPSIVSTDELVDANQEINPLPNDQVADGLTTNDTLNQEAIQDIDQPMDITIGETTQPQLPESSSNLDPVMALSTFSDKLNQSTIPMVLESQPPNTTPGISEPPPANGEQDMVRSREMSLSIDSNPDPSSVETVPANQIPGSSEQLIVDLTLSNPSSSTAFQSISQSAPCDSAPDNVSPQIATALKFPLPAKPAVDPSKPLFAPSPPTSSTQQVQPRSPARQPVLSRLASLKLRVEKDPMDGEAWIELIADAEKKGDLEKTREVYSSFLQNFPDAANQWVAYADLELGHGHFPEVEQIFSRCLRSSVSVELWAFYLNYIRRVNPVEGDKAAASRAIIISAYDFSLNHIGIDHESGQIWMDYINIVKAGEASGTWQEQQKMDTLRKLYQRAVCIPLDNIEQIWKEYDHFEHQMSKMTAKKFLADKSAQYMMARSALKEMKTLTDSLLKPKVPVKPNWKRVNDHKNLAQWKAYLAWEEKNPLEISDKNILNTRIQYAYRQAVMHMRFHPEIWYLAADHLERNGKLEEALTVLQAGLTANPTSIVLTYAIVETQENLKNYPACHAAFNSLLEHYHSEIDEINKTIEKEIANGIPIIESKTNATVADNEVGHELTEEEKQRVKEEEQLRANITALYKPKIDELREAAASVWVTEMRFARRTEGIKPARAVFTRARKSPYITRHVFEASAMMEYHWNKEAAVATKVFDLGLKTFSEEVTYVLQYLDFLITLNDDSNARALFEKTVSKIPPESARSLWRRWAAYEFIYGDQTASAKLNLRIAETFPDWGVTERLSDRHTYPGLSDVLGRELGTSIVPIPLRRSPTPIPEHLEGFGFRRTANHDPTHAGQVPLGPAQPRPRQRDRSFSPEFRGKRARAPRNSPSPDRRNGGPLDANLPPNKRGRENHEVTKRNRYSSPLRGRDTPPPNASARENPYGWFPESLRYFLGILPIATSFEGPRLDTHTVLQVLVDANIPSGSLALGSTGYTNNGVNRSSAAGGGISGASGGSRDGFHSNGPPGWGPNRGGGTGGGTLHQSTGRANSNSTRRGRRK
ncbi:hypothetical protein O181_046194 [Austropuccinia psidii MF-1]|uniref:mRNA 3'-end-processing protein RNA14 n=1 Tax=Austropuccinia psidii MF-1 TaxID=1389203 RepID=A0A9Q3DNF8_9BASI|nr:hypothetical protein [Austropuccinia psidii MF-1]